MPGLELFLLGSFQAKLDDTSLTEFRSDKARALLAYLAVEAAQPHRRESLLELLWDADSQRAIQASLRMVLANMRKLLDPIEPDEEIGSLFVTQRQTVQLNTNHPAYWSDLDEFGRLLAACDRHQHEQLQTCALCVESLIKASRLYRGGFLAGLTLADAPNFDDWQRHQQETLHRQAIDVLGILTDFYLNHQEYIQAQDYARQQIKLEPWGERGQRQLMQALAANGQRSAALGRYEIICQILWDEMELRPSAETTALYEQIRNEARVSNSPRPINGDSPAEQNPVFESAPDFVGKSSGPDPAEIDRRLSIEARLEPIAHHRLFGVEPHQRQLRDILEARSEPWLISIEGMGGLGKTSLADRLIRDFVQSAHYVDIAWISAKQETFQPLRGILSTGQPTLDATALINLLLGQLEPDLLHIATDKRRTALTRLLKQAAHLVVIDNLETVEDYLALLPTLRALANPTKFLLTSRHSLKSQPDVYCQPLSELSRADALAFLRHEGLVRGFPALAEAEEDQLASIYDVVGGNPLALKLVIGQIHILPLSRILEQLKQAKSKPEQDLYTYIYWRAWEALSPPGRQTLLSMPMASSRGMIFDHLARVSNLSSDSLSQAIAELARFSLLEIGGDLAQPRYRIHRLTETFLLTEIAHWQ